MNKTDSTETIFERALGIDSQAKREIFVREACAGNEPMLERLQGLLRAHDRAGKFLEHAEPADGESGSVPGAVASALTGTMILPLTEKPGDRIGRYKLLEKIGEGGCGVVYMAEQKEPVRRRVALKVIKLGMDTEAVIARFEAERQALALMDHPNIAKVLEAGATESPLPDSEGRARHSVRAEVQMQDSGAQGTDAPYQPESGAQRSDAPYQRQPALSAGRPYFVMELVRGTKITEYCDHNNLTTPERLKLFMQVCRAIQHAHQKGIIHRDIKPSNILVTLHDGVPVPKVIDFGIAKATQGRLTDKTVFTAFHQFIGTPAYMSPEQAEMSGLDIDTRSDIYSLGVLLYELLTGKTPLDSQELLEAGLDAMLRTIREQEPERPSTKLSTMVKGELTTTAKRRHTEPPRLIHAVRGDLDWIVMKALEKDRSRRYETANGLASDVARHLNNEPVVARSPSNLYRFQKLIRRNKLAFAAGTTILMTLLTGTVVSSWQAMRARQAKRETENALKDSEEARLQAQAVSKYLVQTFQSIDPYRDGRDIRVVDVLDRAAANLDADFAGSPATRGELLDALGQSYCALWLTAKALDVLEKARAVHQSVLGPDHPDTLGVNIHIFQAYRIARRLADGIPLLEDTLKRSKSKLGSDHPLTLTTMKDLGDAYRAAGRLTDAAQLLEETLKLCKAKVGPDDPTTLCTMNNLALAYQAAGRPAEAVSMLEETLKFMKTRLGLDHRETLNTTDNLANGYRATRRLADAVPMLEETLRVCKAKFGLDHPDTLNTMNFLGDAYREIGRSADAVPMLEETLKLMKAKLGPGNGMTLDATDNLVLAYRAAGQLAEAETLGRELLAANRKLFGSDRTELARALGGLTDTLVFETKFAEAQPLAIEWLGNLRAHLGAADRRLAVPLAYLTYILLAEEKFVEAEPPARECVAICEKKLPDDWQTPHARSLLGGSLLGQKKYAEAEPLLLSGYEGMRERRDKIPAEHKARLKESIQRLMDLYQATDRPSQAAEWGKKLAELDKTEGEKREQRAGP